MQDLKNQTLTGKNMQEIIDNEDLRIDDDKSPVESPDDHNKGNILIKDGEEEVKPNDPKVQLVENHTRIN